MPQSLADLLSHADQLSDAFENFQPAGPAQVTALGELYLAVQGRAASERRLQKAVGSAREDGASWELIGRMLGTSGEAARQKFGAGTGRRTKRAARTATKSTPARTTKTAAKAATTTTAKAAAVKQATTKSSNLGLAAHTSRKRQPA